MEQPTYYRSAAAELARSARRRRNRRRCLMGLILLLAATVGLVLFLLRGLLFRPEEAPVEAEEATAVIAWGERVFGTVNTLKSIEPMEPEFAETKLVNIRQEELLLGDLSLVSNDHACLFPEGLALSNVYEMKTGGYNVRDTDLYVAQRIMEPLNQMAADFRAETGNADLLVCAGYRSQEEQQDLWDNAMANHGEAYTRQYFSVPGCSEHHTGLAVDFAFYQVDSGESYEFDGAGDGQWILDNSWKYGFVQRYPPDKEEITGISEEAWHFRYVGQPHAAIIYEKNLCLEEYLDYLQGFPYEGEHLLAETQEARYEIWYCSENEVCVPAEGTYTLSGDNMGGCIVTVRLD